MSFEKMKEELMGDVNYAIDKNYNKNAIQLRLNRVNDLIDLYNKHQNEINSLKYELSEIEMDVFKHCLDGTRMIEKMFLIFEMIGISRKDVQHNLERSIDELKSKNAFSNEFEKKAKNISIASMIAKRYNKNSDYNYYLILNNLSPEVVSSVAMTDFMRLKKQFGAIAG